MVGNNSGTKKNVNLLYSQSKVTKSGPLTFQSRTPSLLKKQFKLGMNWKGIYMYYYMRSGMNVKNISECMKATVC